MKHIFKLVIVASSCLFTLSALAENCLHGCPTGKSGQTVTNAIYTLQNNSSTKFADWAAYQITPDTIDGPSRSRRWKSDPNIRSSATLEPSDYDDAHAILHTDRGHQVPLGAFSNTNDWSKTNYLSNITPQTSDLNQGAWVRLESEIRDFVRTGQDTYVVTGPLYEWYFGSLPDADESHRIPSGYFKVVMTNNRGWIEASAFIMEQDIDRRADYCRYEVTVNEVERRTGLNIMPRLPSYKESAVEGRTGGLTRELGCN